ncbi:MAG: alpha-galactosidase [Erysipelotrichaceae bacterium]|nr:alpha-galactosidase [Erysipelotrichaceae bacterium]
MKNIIYDDGVFLLNTKNTSYCFKVNDYLHLEHVHYGNRIEINDVDALTLKRSIAYGDSVLYEQGSQYCLDATCLEYGNVGRGDFKEDSILTNINIADFKFEDYEIVDGDVDPANLPNAYGADETLKVTLIDINLQLDLYYGLFYETDVITRRVVVTNVSNNSIHLNKVMSMCLDLTQDDLMLLDFTGAWSNEVNKNEKKIQTGTYVVSSNTGFSSNRTNPGFIIKKGHTDEFHGEAWGFNLIYSGSHYSSINKNDKGIVRINSGINYINFDYELNKDDSFYTPVVVLTYSDGGLNELSHHFHDFINENIVRGTYKKKERPILINSWEAYMFDYNKRKLLALANKAKDLGIELFVLDDGWFSTRNDDTSGLGDYNVNKKKLPGGIKALSNKIHELDMKFGLWVEPEAINPDSDLYRAHPDWAIEDNEYKTLYERNELLLDLTKSEVRDYIVENINKLIEDNNIDYIKWDMNRQLIGVSGKYDYEYIKGLYEVLDRIFKDKDVLFESCSSGGNRFDLGMLCYSPQIWSSDDTDAIERIKIQKNLSYLYPLSTMGAHVSASPSTAVLRKTPLNTRFNVACFGDLGYELDLNNLSSLEINEIKKQVEFYKQHRQTFQYGKFYRVESSDNKESFEVKLDETIVGKFRKLMNSSVGFDTLKVIDLKDGMYDITSRPFSINIETFGHLINFVLPFKVNTEGLLVKEVSKYKGLDSKQEHYVASSNALKQGIKLNNLYISSGYNEDVRLPLDFGSELYLIKEKKDNE